jgi:hypothetical protein
VSLAGSRSKGLLHLPWSGLSLLRPLPDLLAGRPTADASPYTGENRVDAHAALGITIRAQVHPIIVTAPSQLRLRPVRVGGWALELLSQVEDRKILPEEMIAPLPFPAAIPVLRAYYQGIRNPAAHEHEVDWDEQPVLEYLAALRVPARWIDKASVEIA